MTRTMWGLLVAVGAMAAAGWLDRSLRASRQTSAAVLEAVARLEQLPLRIGEWEGRDTTLDELVIRVAGCAGYKNRQFVHTVTGRRLDVTLMVGPAGEMAEHMPETCYAASGYTQLRNSLRRHDLAAFGSHLKGELVSLDFVQPQSERIVRIWHGWFNGSTWSRPEYPRLAFFREKVLFRMQTSAYLVPDPFQADLTIDVGEEFLRDALPTLNNVLRAATEEGEG